MRYAIASVNNGHHLLQTQFLTEFSDIDSVLNDLLCPMKKSQEKKRQAGVEQ